MKKKIFVIGGIIVIAGAAGVGGWYYYKENYANTSEASGEVAYVTKIRTLLGEDSGVMNRFARCGRASGHSKGKYRKRQNGNRSKGKDWRGSKEGPAVI